MSESKLASTTADMTSSNQVSKNFMYLSEFGYETKKLTTISIVSTLSLMIENY